MSGKLMVDVGTWDRQNKALRDYEVEIDRLTKENKRLLADEDLSLSTIVKIKAECANLKAETIEAEKVVADLRQEIKATWATARECDSQMESFRLFERMTDRLGYGRTENNPTLAKDFK